MDKLLFFKMKCKGFLLLGLIRNIWNQWLGEEIKKATTIVMAFALPLGLEPRTL